MKVMNSIVKNFFLYIILLLVSLLLISSMVMAEQPEAEESAAGELLDELLVTGPPSAEEAVPAGEKIEFDADPGITPDSPFYFLDEFLEIVGDDPEKARQYQKEKLAELRAMAREKKAAAAQKALENAQEYGRFLEKEVAPEMAEEIAASAEAVEALLTEASADLPELKDGIMEKLAQEERIALAVKVAQRIKQLCETLARLDPQQYTETCKTDEDDPRWQQRYDQQLTKEQQQHARKFTAILNQCFESQGKECDCESTGVKRFAEICATHRDLKIRCDAGQEEACRAMMEQPPLEDIFDTLPDYLQPVMEKLMEQFMRKEMERTGGEMMLPSPCVDADITSPFKCMKFMKEKFPEGFDFGSEFGSESAEGVVFGPGPCRDAGITTVEECNKYMNENFQKTAEWTYSVPRGPPARIEEFGRDCQALPDLAEKVRCLEDFYNQAQGQYEQGLSKPVSPFPDQKVSLPPDPEWARKYAFLYFTARTLKERDGAMFGVSVEAEERGYLIKSLSAETGGRRLGFKISYYDENGVEHTEEYHQDVDVTEEEYRGEERWESAETLPAAGGTEEEPTPCPLLPTVESCPPGQRKEKYMSSADCGTYYSCVVEEPAVVEIPSVEEAVAEPDDGNNENREESESSSNAADSGNSSGEGSGEGAGDYSIITKEASAE